MDEFINSSDDRFFVATIGNYNSALGSTLILPGTTTPTTKRYKRAVTATLSAGQRVLVMKFSGTYLIIGRIS